MDTSERARRTHRADQLCRDAFARATSRAISQGQHDVGIGVALVAVGGYGRGELAPHSDLDVVLVHDPGAGEEAERIAAVLWYPLWDAHYDLDHAVRSLPQMMARAEADLKVALGLLDVRHLAGDPGLTVRLRTQVLAAWRKRARERMPELAALTRRRHQIVGEIAHASVPDLKEGDGGLRDATTLKALAATWLVELPHADLERARQELLEVRDALHAEAGRAVDRVAPELWGPLADRLGLPGPLAAQVHVRGIGRRIAHLGRLGWRRMEAHLARPAHVVGGRRPELTRLAPGVALSAGEVVLAPGTRAASDPLLLVRACAEAASRDLVLNPATAARLVRDCPPLPEPWPGEARDLLVRLLASGRGLFAVWETLDETGALARLLPEWETIRTLPHASPIHRWTVDRHVIETCIAASALIREVGRPDVLMVAALLHDIGKGLPGDHSREGEPVARAIAARMGFEAEAIDQIGTLVRHHLLLGQLTTTRDPDDPATAELVAHALGDHPGSADLLDLLHALTRADASAVSAQAWTPWRARLTEHLVTRVRHRLAGRELTVAAPDTVPITADEGGVTVAVERLTDGADPISRVIVAAPDRVGLATDVAALLAFVRARVSSARLWTVPGTAGPVGLSHWDVVGVELDARVLRSRFLAITEGRSVPPARLHNSAPGDVAAKVLVRPDAATSASILEVRAADRPGLLHRVLTVLASAGVSVSSAHVDSHGPAAVDVFYLTDAAHRPLSPARATRVAGAVAEALAPVDPR